MQEVMTQLGRGNERFQRLDAEILVLKNKLEAHDRRFDKDIPEAMALIRSDMLRAFASAIEESKKSIEAVVAPIKKDMEPINDVVSKTHTLIKWGLASAGTVIIALITAYALHWFSL